MATAPVTPSGRPGTVLAAVCLAALVLPLSFSGGAVATPAIAAELGGSPAAQAWITNAFLLTFGSTLMAAGALADRFGRRRLFVAGISAFAVQSLALGVVPSLLLLDCLRAGQGLAAAAALAGGTAALAQVYAGPARMRAFSLLGTTFGTGLAFGPLLAGALISLSGWRSIFLGVAGIGVLSLVLTVRQMPESRDPGAAGLDWSGALTFTALLTLFTAAAIEAPGLGWGHPAVVAALLGAVGLLAVFVGIELRSVRPMLDLSLFRYPRFVGVQVLPVATCACYVVLLVLLPLRFIGISGFSPLAAGGLLVALSAPMLVVPLVASSLLRWVSAGVLCGVGLVLAAAGLLWLGQGDVAAGGMRVVLPMLLPMLLIGIGTGLPWGLMDGLSVSVVPPERAGMATGIFSTVRVAGEGVALALVNALLAGLIQTRLGKGAESEELAAASQRLAMGDLHGAAAAVPDLAASTLRQGYAVAFQQLTLVLAGLTLLSALVIFVLLRHREGEV